MTKKPGGRKPKYTDDKTLHSSAPPAVQRQSDSLLNVQKGTISSSEASAKEEEWKRRREIRKQDKAERFRKKQTIGKKVDQKRSNLRRQKFQHEYSGEGGADNLGRPVEEEYVGERSLGLPHNRLMYAS
eukprot:6928767-Ditylum_brightwellii.AAC.1